MTHVGLILSGCGYLDGSEIQEAVLAMVSLQEAGATVECLAPSRPQTQVTNHQTGKGASEQRDVLAEAARIARGHVRPLAEASPADYDALVLPGGFGAALNLSDFAGKGKDCRLDPDLERLLRGAHEAGKPIGAICIAPAVVAKALGRHAPRLTIGNDAGTAAALTALGARHVDCPVDQIVVDEENLLVSTPAYMLGASAKDIHPGIRRLASEVVRLAHSQQSPRGRKGT